MLNGPKKVIALMAMLFLAFVVSPGAWSSEGRVVVPLTNDWKFMKGDEALPSNAGAWGEVTVPHCWNSLDVGPLVFDGSQSVGPRPYRGIGWYARDLAIHRDWRGRRLFIHFEAASQWSTVYVNQKLVGEHRGAFTAFSFEITDFIDWDGKNELSVQVSNALNYDILPIKGDFNIQGGLYRQVRLLVTNPICISPVSDGTSGVRIIQEKLTNEQAVLGVRVHRMGPLTSGKIELRALVLAADGATVASASKSVQNGNGCDDVQLTIPNPIRWHGLDCPYRYSVVVSLHTGEVECDRIATPFGLRDVAISEQDGFLLNGRPYQIRGVNRHQDIQGKGWAMSEECLATIRLAGLRQLDWPIFEQPGQPKIKLQWVLFSVWKTAPTEVVKRSAIRSRSG